MPSPQSLEHSHKFPVVIVSDIKLHLKIFHCSFHTEIEINAQMFLRPAIWNAEFNFLNTNP
jgi:hypothetical protein